MLDLTYSLSNGATFRVSIAETASARDQTSAIQQALNAVAAAGGGTVSLSAGTWTVQGTGKAADGALRVSANTTLEGAGGATVLKLADGSGSVTGIVRTDSGKAKADGSVTTVSNACIKNLAIDGNAAHTSGDVDGVYCGPKPGTAQADTGITIDGVEVFNCSRYGIDPHERVIGLVVRNCSAHDNGVDGFVIDFCADALFDGNVAFGNGRHGFNVVTGSNHVLMSNNSAHDNGGSGISVQTGDNEIRAWTDQIQIIGGLVANNGRFGVEVKQASNVVISGVAVSGNGMDGVRLAGVEGAVLDANSFAGNGGSGTVRIETYQQDFDDADALNDRWVVSTGVVIDGGAMAVSALPAGATTWTYVVSDGDDVISGSAGQDVIAAGSGNDRVSGNGGADQLYGNDGADTLDGGVGDDRVLGGAGNDWLIYTAGFDVLDGGAGRDTADFSSFGMAVVIDMTSSLAEASAGGQAIADFVSIETVIGTAFDDSIKGTTSANTLDGGDGNDTIDASAGDDTVFGGGGNDRLIGGLGNDSLSGGAGADVFVFTTASGRDVIADFVRGEDVLEITGTTMAGLKISQSGGDTVIKVGSSEIMLKGMHAALLTASDFAFH